MSRATGSSIPSGQTMVCSGRGFVFGRVEIVTWLWIVCAIATLAVSQQNPFYTHGRYGKRGESYAQASPFFSGSRYGRGGPTSARESKSEPKMLEVSPRVDRFFLGSRYGKRGSSMNDDDDNVNRRRLQPPSRIPSVRRFEETPDSQARVQRADRVLLARNNYYGRKSGDGDKRNNGEVLPMDIPNEDELDNFW